MSDGDDIKKRHKRLRLTRKEIHVLLQFAGGHLETEEDEEIQRHGESASAKLRAELRRLIAMEAKSGN